MYCIGADGADVMKFLVITCLALGGFGLVLIGCTYGRWEFLSWRYASEFYPPIKQAVDAGCLSEYPQVIKVVNDNQLSAVIWFKGESGSTWIAEPWRSFEKPHWQFQKRASSGAYYCDIDIINSTSGGSADGFHWYN